MTRVLSHCLRRALLPPAAEHAHTWALVQNAGYFAYPLEKASARFWIYLGATATVKPR